MVEFALVLPIMLLLLAAAIDLGRLFYAYVAVENAAKEGAFFGARNPLCDDGVNSNCGNPNNVLWHVANEAPNLGSQFSDDRGLPGHRRRPHAADQQLPRRDEVPGHGDLSVPADHPDPRARSSGRR